ncbi:type IV pilus inner membrane component PilO [Roseateles terrae]|uniref:Type IV pilus assembly protein PilO n=1 Tax=Roseateles terrae TaxID=431060 RepID=A0ABR6GVD9_9BURK|nr:type 4a pilus biogenesis protein PilO [Roseateles terrae]MBB3195706.1 type IV pilus assembly protein PilO [Roseateles terrae]OWQ86604.1 pilus assembly protein PilO [Roseateles terrae]
MADLKNLDLNAWFADFSSQFQNLDPKKPGQWPAAPKFLTFIFVAVAAVVVAWFVVLSDANDALEAEKAREPVLKEDYRGKLAQAVNLPELLKQKRQVEEYVLQLEKQLPGKAEMDALLSDINQAGLGRGLQFELFRPGQIVMKDYYAEQPISLKVSGQYHDIGSFTADVSNLSRIVTLHDLNIGTPQQQGNGPKAGDGHLVMEATARTYRYLDPAEVEEQKRTQQQAGKKK